LAVTKAPGEQERAVGEVHHLGGLEDDDEPEGDQRIDEAEREPREQQLQKQRHEGFSG
jgi:hypothetical protein